MFKYSISLYVLFTFLAISLSDCHKPCGDCEKQPLWNDSTHYPKDAVVRYGHECYKALVDSTTDTPGAWGKTGNNEWVSCNTF
ncbi:MAG: hypothetical protein NZM35_01330 [Chitinophagales bacterium]|nr:hypothetical protein [Chitinophagales bacterium]MDW8419723.1 hypothetical protein [Chitinophagales bacterium]